ncbi:MAG: MATE family efflux transporter [Deltaproteobacteria bacterium]|nr:MATE family efflux transporter [Deltaproteobacteria bacterium]
MASSRKPDDGNDGGRSIRADRLTSSARLLAYKSTLRAGPPGALGRRGASAAARLPADSYAAHGYLTELRRLWRLALPLAAAHAGSEIMRLVDTAVVGRIGAVPLGALGLGNALFFSVTVLAMGIMLGFDPLIAQALGAAGSARARRLWWQAVWAALLLGAAASVLVAAIIPAIEPLGLDPELAAATRPVLAVRIAGIVPFLLFVATRSYLQAVGRTAPLVTAMVVGNLVNLAAVFPLVFGGSVLPAWAGALRGLPALGAAGAAAATSIAFVAQLAVVLLALRAVPCPELARGSRRPARRELGQAWRVGLPVGLQIGAEVGIFALVAFLAGRLGPLPLAAHQVALTLASFTFMVVLGVSSAGSVRVGRAIGAADPAGTRRAGLVAMGSGAAFMALSATALLLFPRDLARLLTDQPAVVAAAVPLVAVAAVFQLSDGLQAVASGALRGAGDTRFALVANLAGHYAVGLPLAVGLSFGLGLGVVGLWWGLWAGLTTVAALLLVRFVRLSSRPIAPIEAPGRANADPRPAPC